jgi:hypothetical protein
MRSNETLNNRSTELNPHANFTNSTHARLRQQLNATQLNTSQVATTLPNKGTFTTRSGSVIQVSSANANEVCRVTNALISNPDMGVTLGGECKEERAILYYNSECDSGLNHNDPNWLTQMMLTSCDLNTTALPENMVNLISHFCNDGPDAIRNLEDGSNRIHDIMGFILVASFCVCCCAAMCGMLAPRDDEPRSRRNSYQEYSLLHNPDYEGEQDAEANRLNQISNQMNGVSGGPRK